MPFLNLALFMIWFLSEKMIAPLDMSETNLAYITDSLDFYCVCFEKNIVQNFIGRKKKKGDAITRVSIYKCGFALFIILGS